MTGDGMLYPFAALVVGFIAARLAYHRARIELRQAALAVALSDIEQQRMIGRLQRSLRRFSIFGRALRPAKSLALGELLIQQEEFAEAEALLRSTLAQERDVRLVVACRLQLAKVLDGQWRFDEADTEAASGLKLMEHGGAPPGRIILERAELAHRQGDADAAATVLRRALIRTDLSPEERDLIGLRYMLSCVAARRSRDALDYGRGLSEQSLEGPLGHLLAKCVGTLHAHFLQFDKAERLLGSLPDGAPRLALQAHILSARGRHQEALDGARALSQTEREDEQASIFEVIALSRMGRLEEALALAESNVPPDVAQGGAEARAHAALWLSAASQLAILLEEWQQALEWLTRLTGIPRVSRFLTASAATYRAGVLAQLGRTEEADDAFEEARTALSETTRGRIDEGEAALTLGRAALMRGQLTQAREYLGSAAERPVERTQLPCAYYYQGLAAKASGDLGCARDAFRSAVDVGFADHFAALAQGELEELPPSVPVGEG